MLSARGKRKRCWRCWNPSGDGVRLMLNPPALAPAVVATRPLAVSYTDLAFRSIHLRHFANFSAARPLFAAGGEAVGSRYVLPGGPATLYVAFDADTAHREGNQVFY